MIDRLVGEQGSTQSSQAEAPTLHYSDPPQATTSLPLNGLAIYPQPIASFPKQESSQPMAPALEPQPQLLPSLQATEQPEIDFNDFNFDNIIGDTQTNRELPEFDFVSRFVWLGILTDLVQGFWGDPINFGSEPIEFPIDAGYATTWTSWKHFKSLGVVKTRFIVFIDFYTNAEPWPFRAIGSVIPPVVGSYVDENLNWRWHNWSVITVSGAVCIAILFPLPEKYAAALLR
jgi:hypothetical protein